MNSYQKLCTQFYDLDKPQAPEDALNFYLRYAEQANGPILEPMCGSGRFLIPLLERGFDIDGVDTSPYMLQACRDRCKNHGFEPVLSQQSVERMDLPRRYGLVLIPASSFCLITERKRVMESLKRVYDLMLPGANFVLEVETPRAQSVHTGQWSGKWVERPDGAKILLSGRSVYDERAHISRSIHRYELFKGGTLLEAEFEEFDLRLYEPSEFRSLLEATGFKGVQLFKAYRFCEPDHTDQRIVFECYKSSRGGAPI